jgi:hypothetical protein
MGFRVFGSLIVPTSLLQAGGTIASGVIGSNAYGAGAKQIGTAVTNANTNEANVEAQSTANLSPYVQQGTAAESELSGLEGLNGAAGSAAANGALSTYLGSTNYQFALGQGEQGIDSANASSFNSGATAKALDNYATGTAESALGGYVSQLQNQTGVGATSAGTLGQLGNQNAAQVSQNTIGGTEQQVSEQNAGTLQQQAIVSGLTGAAAQGLQSSSYGSTGGGSGFGSLAGVGNEGNESLSSATGSGGFGGGGSASDDDLAALGG